MKQKALPLTDLRVGAKQGLDEGAFTAYASVFGNVDHHGDVVRPGAFTDSIKAWAGTDRAIPILYGHRDDDPDYNVGHVVSATEDGHGLKIHGQLDLDSPKGAQTYRLLKGRRLSELSFGYSVADAGPTQIDGKSVTELRRLDLHEVSLVPRGANPATEVLTVKAAPAPRTHLDTLPVRLALTDLTTPEGTKTMSNPNDLTAQRAALVDQIETIRTKAAEESGERDKFTAEETELLHIALDALKQLDEKIAEQKKGRALLDALDGIAPNNHKHSGSAHAGHQLTKGHLDVSAKAFAGIADRALKDLPTHHGKAVLAGGTATEVTLAPEPVLDARPMSELIAALPVVRQSSPTFRYLRQTARTNNAAIVAPGEQKPESEYTLTSVDGELQVLAHVSEAVDKYALTDVANLQRFIGDELLYGLHRGLEHQILNGDGDGELLGLLETSGIQTESFATDLLTTTRKAVTKIENAGYTAGLFVLSPADWESLELARTDSAGSLELGGPVDRAARTLWDVPVAICNQLGADTGLLLDPATVALDTDGAVEVLWSDAVGDDFQRNQLRARCESRYHLSVYQPLGTVKMTTGE